MDPSHPISHRLFWLAFVAAFVGARPVGWSAEIQWDGELNTDWHGVDAEVGRTNWDPEQFPGEGDTVRINSGPVSLQLRDVSLREIEATGLSIGRGLTIGARATLTNTRLVGGYLSGAGEITLEGNSIWTHGGLQNAHRILNNGYLAIYSEGQTRGMLDVTFDNTGEIGQSASINAASTRLVNYGTWTLQNTGPVDAGNGTFENQGTLIGKANASTGLYLENRNGTLKAVGTGDRLVVSGASTFDGGSILLDNGGTVSFGNQPHRIRGTVSAEGEGDLELGGTVTVEGSLVADLVSSRGLALLPSTLLGPGGVVSSGRSLLSGVVISNTLGVANQAPGGAERMILGGDFNVRVDTVLTNAGELVHEARALQIAEGGAVRNGPTGRYLVVNASPGPQITGLGMFRNQGLLRKSGAGAASLSAGFHLDGGTVEVREGLLSFAGPASPDPGSGTFRVDAGASLSLASSQFILRGVYRFEGAGTVSLSSAWGFASDGPTVFAVNPEDGSEGRVWWNDNDPVTLASPVENHGHFQWTGNGRLSATGAGRLVNRASGQLLLAGAPFLATRLENDGLITQASAANLRLAPDAELANRRQYEVTAGQMSRPEGGSPYVVNAAGATFRKWDPGHFAIRVPFNNAGGTVTVDGGSLTLEEGGVHTANARFTVGDDTALFLDGTHRFLGDTTFEGMGTARPGGTWVIESGTARLALGDPKENLTFDSGLRLDSAGARMETVGGAQTLHEGLTGWSLGVLAGGSRAEDGTVTGGHVVRGAMHLIGRDTSAPELAGVLVNEGTLFHAGSLRLSEAGSLVNRGIHLIDNPSESFPRDASLVSTPGSTTRFVNEGGALVVTNRNRFIVAGPFDLPAGKAEVFTGRLRLTGGSRSKGSGLVQLHSGGSLDLERSIYSFEGEYLVTGPGTAAIHSATVQGDIVFDLNPGGLKVFGGTFIGGDGRVPVNAGTAWVTGATIEGDGLFNTGLLVINPDSTLTIQADSRLWNGGVLSQHGSLTVDGRLHNNQGATLSSLGEVHGSGRVINEAGATLFFRGTKNRTVSPTVDNLGTVQVGMLVNEPSTVRMARSAQFDASTGVLSGGRWLVGGGSTLTLGSGETLRENAGEVILDPRANLGNLPFSVSGGFRNRGMLSLHGARRFSGTFENSGTLLVNGEVQAGAFLFPKGASVGGTGKLVDDRGELYANGTWRPGSSPGILTVDASLVLGPDSILEAEIAGPGPADHDRLGVIGSVALDGILRPVLLDGFVPEAGRRFEIVGATAVRGTFAAVDNSLVGANRRFTVSVGPTAVELVTQVAPAADYAAFRAAAFSPSQAADPSVSDPDRDPDGDGIINALEHVFGLRALHPDPQPLRLESVRVNEVARTKEIDLTFPWAEGLVGVSWAMEGAHHIRGPWQPVDPEVIESVAMHGVTRLKVRVTQPEDGPSPEFLRLRLIGS